LPSAPSEPPPVTLTFRLVNAGVRVLMAIGRERLVVEGLDLLPDRPGVILASNHLSFADPVLLAMVVHRTLGRRVRHMAKAEAVAIPVFGALLRDYGGFAVRRGRPDREAYRMANEVLAGGDWLGLAPEGTRSRTGTLGEPKPGVALLALRSGAEVVPVALWGTEALWPVGALLPRPGKEVHIRFGAPYRMSSQASDSIGQRAPTGDGHETTGDGHETAPTGAQQAPTMGRHAALDAASDDLMRRIADLLPEAYRGRFR
jgi:1-acyl-sn-glycerol-3-phosphate acyltransferase